MSEGWVNEAMSESMSCAYVGVAYGAGDFLARMEKYRTLWEETIKPGTTASLVRAYENRQYQPSIVYNYGPYVMHMMLRVKMGDDAFFKAIRGFLADHNKEYISAEQFLAALQAETEIDLSDFFDFWIYGGTIPQVSLEYNIYDDKIKGVITSDVPFGTFEVPVHFVTKEDSATPLVWVKVVDGRGTFESPALTNAAKTKVDLDPYGAILATKRKVKRNKSLSLE